MTRLSAEPLEGGGAGLAPGQDARAASVAFGRRLREVRAGAGLSQGSLAERAGVHPTAIGRMERGGREPRLATILRLARALGVARCARGRAERPASGLIIILGRGCPAGVRSSV
jgi:DNA-binding XRE family transcriptional regulator